MKLSGLELDEIASFPFKRSRADRVDGLESWRSKKALRCADLSEQSGQRVSTIGYRLVRLPHPLGVVTGFDLSRIP